MTIDIAAYVVASVNKAAGEFNRTLGCPQPISLRPSAWMLLSSLLAARRFVELDPLFMAHLRSSVPSAYAGACLLHQERYPPTVQLDSS